MTLDGVMVAISQLIAMVWMSHPIPEISPASQIARNVRLLRGANGPVPAAGFCTSMTRLFSDVCFWAPAMIPSVIPDSYVTMPVCKAPRTQVAPSSSDGCRPCGVTIPAVATRRTPTLAHRCPRCAGASSAGSAVPEGLNRLGGKGVDGFGALAHQANDDATKFRFRGIGLAADEAIVAADGIPGTRLDRLGNQHLLRIKHTGEADINSRHRQVSIAPRRRPYGRGRTSRSIPTRTNCTGVPAWAATKRSIGQRVPAARWKSVRLFTASC